MALYLHPEALSDQPEEFRAGVAYAAHLLRHAAHVYDSELADSALGRVCGEEIGAFAAGIAQGLCDIAGPSAAEAVKRLVA